MEVLRYFSLFMRMTSDAVEQVFGHTGPYSFMMDRWNSTRSGGAGSRVRRGAAAATAAEGVDGVDALHEAEEHLPRKPRSMTAPRTRHA